MSSFIEVGELSAPTLFRELPSDDQDGTINDITGYAIKFMVKHAPTEDTVFPDSRAYFDITGTVTDSATRKYSLALTTAHTCLAPGDYEGEIRWWADGDTTLRPTGREQVIFRINPAIASAV